MIEPMRRRNPELEAAVEWADNVGFPISHYGESEKAGEPLCHTYHHLFEVLHRLRPPAAPGSGHSQEFARLIEAGRPIPVFGDGSIMSDHTFIDDNVDAVENIVVEHHSS